MQIPFAFQTDLATPWPEWGRFRDALKRRDWPAGRAVLDSVSSAERTRLLQQLLPKWGGDWERAHSFARERTFAAPVRLVLGRPDRRARDRGRGRQGGPRGVGR